MCAPGCLDDGSGGLHGWIGDLYCDQTCNVAECQFDGGDCDGQTVTVEFDACLDTGCPTLSWLGDHICDDSCNNPECDFDLGDCDGGDGHSYFYTYGPVRRSPRPRAALPRG